MKDLHIFDRCRVKCRAALPLTALMLCGLLAACGKDGGVLLQRAGDGSSASLPQAQEISLTEAAGGAEGYEKAAPGTSDGDDAANVPETDIQAIPPVTVFVCGEVNEPGVYVLEDGARVFEAVAAAGGFTADAQEDYLNLAQYVQDTQKIYIPGQEEAQRLAAAGEQTGASLTESPQDTGGRININTAGLSELMTIPGIGEARAQTILEFRQANGSFENPEDIMKVSGIKRATYDKLCDYICVR